jgi:CRISPR-associated protein Cas8c/Csd1, subtype I-C/DVULG
MSWIDKLYKTYENNSSSIGDVNDNQIPLWPLWHITQKAHVQITLDNKGNFLRALVIPKNEARTIIPATEESAGRTTNDSPHPLCDKLQYIAGDYKIYGGKKPHHFESYKTQLEQWYNFSKNVKLKSVLEYINKEHIIKDLINSKTFVLDTDGSLLKKWVGKKEETPEIFKILKDIEGQLGAFIRWSVDIKGDPQSNLWSDNNLWEIWSEYYSSTLKKYGICYVTGQERIIAEQHPKKIRNDGDGAKIISSNDINGFTFRGRFTDPSGGQTCSISSEVSQKAHNALRWLIGRKQAFKNGDQVIISWDVSGLSIPDILNDSYYSVFEIENKNTNQTYQGDVGQAFSQRLNKYIAGYSIKIGVTNNITILGLDSASPGRIAIIYYKELTGSEFLKRVEKWHSDFAWKQRVTFEDSEKKKTKIIWPICAPAPKDIAQALYGSRIDDNLKKVTIERLLPCIIDDLAIPLDLVEVAVHRTSNRIGLEYWEWEKVLGVACSLYKGYYLRNPNEKRSYSMALEPDRNSRDYLYGRLLAVAEHIENLALFVGGEERDTTAAKYMQRFADRPFSTWVEIEKALVPYKTRLRSKRAGYLHQKEELLDKIHALFIPSDFENDSRLSGEFLLGYHCQREALKPIEKTEKLEETNC